MNIIYSYLFHGLLPVTEIVFIPTDQVQFQIMHLIFYTVTLSEIKLFKYNTVCNMYTKEFFAFLSVLYNF